MSGLRTLSPMLWRQLGTRARTSSCSASAAAASLYGCKLVLGRPLHTAASASQTQTLLAAYTPPGKEFD